MVTGSKGRILAAAPVLIACEIAGGATLRLPRGGVFGMQKRMRKCTWVVLLGMAGAPWAGLAAQPATEQQLEQAREMVRKIWADIESSRTNATGAVKPPVAQAAPKPVPTQPPSPKPAPVPAKPAPAPARPAPAVHPAPIAAPAGAATRPLRPLPPRTMTQDQEAKARALLEQALQQPAPQPTAPAPPAPTAATVPAPAAKPPVAAKAAPPAAAPAARTTESEQERKARELLEEALQQQPAAKPAAATGAPAPRPAPVMQPLQPAHPTAAAAPPLRRVPPPGATMSPEEEVKARRLLEEALGTPTRPTPPVTTAKPMQPVPIVAPKQPAPKVVEKPAPKPQPVPLVKPVQPAPKPVVVQPVRPVPAAPAGSAARKPSNDPAPRTGETGSRIAMTLRLDSARHLRLKLLAAHEGKSCQALLLEALDALIAQHGPEVTDCACLQGSGTRRDAATDGTASRRRVRA